MPRPDAEPALLAFPPIESAPVGTSSIRQAPVLRTGPMAMPPPRDATWLEFAHRQLRENPSPYVTVNLLRDAVQGLIGMPLALERVQRGYDPHANVGEQNLLMPGLMDMAGASVASAPTRAADALLSIGSIGARKADLRALDRAKRLAAAGHPPEYIQARTGWIKGLPATGNDGWMFEIPDTGMRLKNVVNRPLRYGDPTEAPGFYLGYDPKQSARLHRRADMQLFPREVRGGGGTEFFQATADAPVPYVLHDKKFNPQTGRYGPVRLDDLISHNELFDNYPHLRNIPVRSTDSLPQVWSNTMGGYLPGRGSIHVNALEPREVKPLLLHEIAHAVQDLERLQFGGTPQRFLPENYWNARKLLYGVAGNARQSVANIIGFPEEKALHDELWDLFTGRAAGPAQDAPTLRMLYATRPDLHAVLANYELALRRAAPVARADIDSFNMYRGLHGEEVAHAVERRGDMSADALRTSPFAQYYDTPLERHFTDSTARLPNITLSPWLLQRAPKKD